jgi:uncharacterized SAM-binding protein YcdF (DUF218 family)
MLKTRRWRIFVLAITTILAIIWAATAGSFLVIDTPLASDVILVLAGETEKRPQRALKLLDQHYGQRVILDVPSNATIYEFTQIQLAERYVHDLPQPNLVSICSIDGLSTKDESKDAEKCLQRDGAKSVLIVTSDFHTRRALDIFRHELPQHEFSIAASHNEQAFGSRWWTHRQWAKTFIDEWLRLLWWKLIDQWRR